jgi:trimeric autotransporter adhesin
MLRSSGDHSIRLNSPQRQPVAKRAVTALASVIFGATALLTACGGGGGGSGAAGSGLIPFSATVIDGAILNALVCLDKNANGVCDAGEPQGRTNASGNVTFNIAAADAGKYPVLAVVGTDATDADTGAITTPYVMTAPADQPAVVSPLTTLVQQVITTTGASTADAAASVQGTLGLNASVFQNYTTTAVPTDGSQNPATRARLVVVTTQQQAAAITSAVGTTTVDNTVITKAMLDQAIQKKLLELLPALVTALNDPSVTGATTLAAKEAALLAAANTVVTSSGLTTANISTVVAVNNQTSAPPPAVTPPTAGFNLASLDFTDVQNFTARFFAASLAQATPDSNNMTRYMDRHISNVSGNMAKWSFSGSPARNSDLSWDGAAWSVCGLDQENTSTVRDAQGNSKYNFCNNRETGTSNRAVFDVTGQTMLSVYNSMISGGYTNIKIANAATVLGSATFPTGSKEFIQTGTPLTNAIAYFPGASYPAGTSNVMTQFSAAVAAGGVAATQGGTVGCNSSEWNTTNGTNSTTFEAMVPVKGGTPCIYSANSSTFTYNSVAYNSGPTNEAWGNSTISMGVLGNAPLNSGTAPGYYTSNVAFRASFTGTGANAVTYYACKQRFNNGSIRNCTSIGTGSYAISALGDARVMQFNNLPAQMTQLTYTQVLVERGGKIYYGYKNRPIVSNTARLNTVAAGAMLTQMGLPGPFTPLMDPIVLTAASYRGSYAATSPTGSAGNGTILTVNSDMTASCFDLTTSTTTACVLSVSDATTGAFTLVNGANTSTGTVNFLTGAVSGTWTDGVNTTAFVGQRR